MYKKSLFFIFIFCLFLIKNSNAQVFSLQDFYSFNPALDAQVDIIYNSYNDQERVAQMVMQAVGEFGKPEAQIIDLVQKHLIGGVLFLKGNKNEFVSLHQKLKMLSSESIHFPQFITADAEPSLINRKIIGTNTVPKTNAINTNEINIETCNTINTELHEIGINWNFAPDCDININKAIIGNRSYGADINTVITRADEFIQTTQNSQIIATAKHFPGHGNVVGDSHKGLVFINGELKELPIYEQLIANGALSIMVGHIAIRNNATFNTQGLPASCSRLIVTNLLRNKMGFNGLIITDAMNMGAILSVDKTPSLKAIEAGVDIVLMPNGEQKLIELVMQKAQINATFADQIKQSIKRIIRMKICLGLYA